jgi:hypothetical protein
VRHADTFMRSCAAHQPQCQGMLHSHRKRATQAGLNLSVRFILWCGAGKPYGYENIKGGKLRKKKPLTLVSWRGGWTAFALPNHVCNIIPRR